MMHVKRLGLAVAGAMVFTGLLLAQQTPIQGCNGAISCNQPKGFSTLTGNAGGSVLFGVGFRWGPGYEFRVAPPPAAPELRAHAQSGYANLSSAQRRSSPRQPGRSAIALNLRSAGRTCACLLPWLPRGAKRLNGIRRAARPHPAEAERRCAGGADPGQPRSDGGGTCLAMYWVHGNALMGGLMNSKVLKRTILGAVLAGGTALGALAQIPVPPLPGLDVRITTSHPPPVRYEKRIASPGAGYFYVKGFWNWDGGRWGSRAAGIGPRSPKPIDPSPL
jgi:hypothetical protein